MILALVLMLGCGPKLPLELSNPSQNPHPSCDPKTHLWATGIGETQTAAENNANRSIASQIQSSLQSSTRQTAQTFKTTSDNGKYSTKLVEYEKNLLSVIETSTAFDRNDLIEPVIAPQSYKSQFYTLRCLNKSKAGKVLGDELEPVMNSFMKTAELALSFVDEATDPTDHNYAKFTSQFASAVRLRKDILPKLYIIRSITGRPDPRAATFNNTWTELVFKGKEIISQSTIGLDLSSAELPEEEQLLIHEVIRRSLADNGLRVVEQKQCVKGITHVAETVVREHCKPPSQTFGVGHMCKPIVTVTVTECSSNFSSVISLSHKSIQGQDYHSKENAVKFAVKRMEEVDFVDTFTTELSSVLPLNFE